MNFSKLKLSTRITIIMCLVVVVSGLINAYMFTNLTKDLKKDSEDSLKTDREALEHSISAQFYERYGDVQAFTYNQIFSGNDKKAMVETLNQYAVAYGIYDLILVINTDGKLLAINDKSPENKKINTSDIYRYDFKKDSWFNDVLEGKTTDDKSNNFSGTLVTDPSMNSFVKYAYGEDRWANTFTAPIRNNAGKVTGVIHNIANFKWVGNEFLSLYNAKKLSGLSEYDLALLDKTGKLIWEVTPQTFKENKYEINFNTLGKINLAEKGLKIAKDLLENKTGIAEVKNLRTGVLQTASFGMIHEEKFIDSMGWGLIVRLPEASLLGTMQRSVYMFYGFLIGSIILGAVIISIYTRRFGSQLITAASQLENCVNDAAMMSTKMRDASSDLSASSTEQSSAIQESVSALNEMSSMISLTAENSKKSKDTATEVTEKSMTGNATVLKMVESMGSIDDACKNLEVIANSIREVQQKTNMINEIVFKTQLLSFNASIEAARAGQYGKGFAVVAEEVGSLAQNSGTAANEIQTLVNNSQKQVEETMNMIKSRVKDGRIVSDEVARTFKEISGSITSMNTQINSIAEACQQQDVGIQQTQKAMTQLDIAAQKNTQAAASTQVTSDDLTKQNKVLSDLMYNIQTIVIGNAKNNTTDFKSMNLVNANKNYTNNTVLEIQKNSEKLSTNEEDSKLVFDNELNISADDESFKRAA